LDFEHFTQKELTSVVRKSGLYDINKIMERIDELFENNVNKFEAKKWELETINGLLKTKEKEAQGIIAAKDQEKVDSLRLKNHLIEKINQLTKTINQQSKSINQQSKSINQKTNTIDQNNQKINQMTADMKTVKSCFKNQSDGDYDYRTGTRVTMWDKFVSGDIKARYSHL